MLFLFPWTEHQPEPQSSSKSDNIINDNTDDDEDILEQPKTKKLCVGMFHRKIYPVSVTSTSNSWMPNLQMIARGQNVHRNYQRWNFWSTSSLRKWR